MVRNPSNSEYLLVHKTAEEYRSKGYEVLQEARLDFLPGFIADLLVRKGAEARVIEVKSRSSLATSPELSKLARIIESKPGWSLELLLVSEPEKLAAPDSARSFESANIRQRIDEAEKSLKAGLTEAAFVLAWSACEAAARDLIATEGVSDTGIAESGYVFDRAVFEGVISRDEYDTLAQMRKYRNAVIHGYRVDDFSDDMVANLIDTTRRIIDAIDSEYDSETQPVC
jgi:uncharacterized protein YutE (UPF0331/DUF86 family)